MSAANEGMSMPRLGVIITSTRPNRLGLPVAQWFAERARAHGKFEVQLVDLKELALPPMDEPNHPNMKQYQNEHTKAWSRVVTELDAFVFVTPEYNYGLPPALANALNFLYLEWGYKAAAFVSYGGVSGGTRSVQMSKQIVAALRMMAIPEGVFIPFAGKHHRADGHFDPGPTQDEGATRMLDELLRWTGALKNLRGSA